MEPTQTQESSFSIHRWCRRVRQVFSVRFSPDDALVAASTFSGAVYVVNTATGAVEQELATGTELPVMCVPQGCIADAVDVRTTSG